MSLRVSTILSFFVLFLAVNAEQITKNHFSNSFKKTFFISNNQIEQLKDSLKCADYSMLTWEIVRNQDFLYLVASFYNDSFSKVALIDSLGRFNAVSPDLPVTEIGPFVRHNSDLLFYLNCKGCNNYIIRNNSFIQIESEQLDYLNSDEYLKNKYSSVEEFFNRDEWGDLVYERTLIDEILYLYSFKEGFLKVFNIDSQQMMDNYVINQPEGYLHSYVIGKYDRRIYFFSYEKDYNIWFYDTRTGESCIIFNDEFSRDFNTNIQKKNDFGSSAIHTSSYKDTFYIIIETIEGVFVLEYFYQK